MKEENIRRAEKEKRDTRNLERARNEEKAAEKVTSKSFKSNESDYKVKWFGVCVIIFDVLSDGINFDYH